LKMSFYNLTRLLPLTLLFVLFAAAASADVDGPPEWIDLYSYSSILNGMPLPVGALVDAYDPDGVHCGSFIVHTEGRYGFLAVYRDDQDLTPSVDEGADPGDPISLRINDVPATPLGPDAAVWTMNGDNMEVDLSVTYLIDLYLRIPLNDVGTPSQYTAYSFWVLNTGEGTDFFHVSASSEHGWSVDLVSPSTTDYVPSGDSAEVIVRVLVPASAQNGDTDDLTLTATSAMDDAVSEDGIVTTEVWETSADEYDGIVPGVFKLSQNYPNPFNPSTRIEFTLEQAGEVRLEVYNVLGQKIRTLLEGYFPNGSYESEWNGTTEGGAKVSSGIYFYRLSTDQFSRTRKMMLMK